MTQSFKLAVVRGRTGFALKGEFEKALDMFKLLVPDFVIPVGDLIEGYKSDRSTAHHEWEGIDWHIERFDFRFSVLSAIMTVAAN